ncbi:MAG TPA: type I methionyl aminopeptidase [Jatrophihabitantaceae bacterium]|nr:type I methionyl aminopeptidase [Jatrophihabitantaceae bacterium]
MTVRTPIAPAAISARREVPASIAMPHYVGLAEGSSTPADLDDPMVKDADTIARMRIAGRIAADAIVEVSRHVAPGVTTDELDRIGHEFMLDHGAYPSTLGYKGFPKSLCTSVNEVICHGIPDARRLLDGDIVKIDVTAFKDGVHGDTCATFYAGTPSDEVRELGERTREALLRGIRAVAPGRPISVIGRVIESYAKRFGYGVVRDYTGHGVGPSFHTKPTILHYDEPRATTIIEPGMTFTIEPMLTLGGYEWHSWDDDWTIVTADGSWAAQWEHTVAVTESGAEILTLPSD